MVTFKRVNASFSKAIIRWQKQHGRHQLPWQKNPTAYRVWLSEIMLQQTQVNTVIPYFERFIDRFSDVEALASAHIDEVLFLWSGLGYYSRARNLHRAARMVVADFAGIFPKQLEDLIKLPGVGRSTAGAIRALAYRQKAAILDGNVKRVLARYFAISEPINRAATEKSLWQISEACLPNQEIMAYTQGMMDLGATICTRSKPQCTQCPLQASCVAFHQDLQHTIPKREKQKEKPIRQADFILLSQYPHILLKQRPTKGIWGGLWTLPQSEDLIQLSRKSMVAIGPKWLEFRHTFSHFHLDCCIYQGSIDQGESLPKGWIWYNCNLPTALGLAAPIQKVIQQWSLSQAKNKPASRLVAEAQSTYNY